MWIKKLIPAYIQIKSLYTIQQEKILDKELTNLFHLIDTDEYDAAKRVLEILRKKYGDIVPELTRAETMLHFLTTNYE